MNIKTWLRGLLYWLVPSLEYSEKRKSLKAFFDKEPKKESNES